MIVVIAATLGGGDSDSGTGGGSTPAGQVKHGEGGKRNVAKIYVVQIGDTLTSIAHETGVPVARILMLNPGIDPQILVSGEQLKLK